MEQPVENKKKVNRIMPIILGAVLVAGAAIGGSAWLHSRRFTITDDAQIDADISTVSARVGGFIRNIRFNDNQYVHAGDTLMTLDDADLRIKLEQAQAALDAASANTGISRVSVASTKANLGPVAGNIEAARARVWKAEEDYKRYEPLLQSKVVTQEKFDAIKAEKQAAEADLASLQSQLGAVEKQVSVARERVGGDVAKIRQAAADVDWARLQLSYATITAPISGIVSKRAVQVGQLVSTGSPLVSIVNIDSMYVTANFKETQMRKLRTGLRVLIDVDAFPGKPLTGRVASFSGATGAKFSLLPPDNATGNFVKVVQRMPVRISINIPDNLRGVIKPGMSVKAEVCVK